MTFEDHTVTRVVTAHAPLDEDGTNVKMIHQQVDLLPFLDGAAFRTQIFTHLGAPAISEHQFDQAGIDSANRLTQHVTLENGVSSCVMDMAPGSKIDLHRTESVDHIVILSGSVVMTYPVGSAEKDIELKMGDVLVQRGTTHGWVAGTEGVRMFSVMIHAKPVKVEKSGKMLEEFWA